MVVAHTAMTIEQVSEQKLRAAIAALDRKIASQAKHIAKLERELTEKRNERANLVRQRIDLLQRELPTE